MSPLHAHCQHVTRRHFLRDCGVGLGKIALAGLLTDALGNPRVCSTAVFQCLIKPSRVTE